MRNEKQTANHCLESETRHLSIDYDNINLHAPCKQYIMHSIGANCFFASPAAVINGMAGEQRTATNLSMMMKMEVMLNDAQARATDSRDAAAGAKLMKD